MEGTNCVSFHQSLLCLYDMIKQHQEVYGLEMNLIAPSIFIS